MRSRGGTGNLSGVLVVDKPAGPTSFEVVRRLRSALGVKKVGHTGTLDPLATGLLTLCLNRATKLVPFLQAGEKEYQGSMILGLSTDTDDITGRVTSKKICLNIGPRDIIKAAREFIGVIEQIPPAYSAVKFQGRPAYKLARQGEKVPVKSREVIIHDLAVTEIDLPRISFHVRVSKGTYIRSLAADLGRRLRTGACLRTLRRLSSVPFTLDTAVPLDEAEDLARAGRLEERVIPLEQALSFMPEVRISGDAVRLVENGQPLPLTSLDDFRPQPGPVRILAKGIGLLAVYQYTPPTGTQDKESLTPLRVLGGN